MVRSLKVATDDGFVHEVNSIATGEAWHGGELLKSIAELTQLKHLDLNDNGLTVLPSEYSRLIYLEHLDISENNFKVFPTCIGALTHLTELNLNNSIDNLTQLDAMDRIYKDLNCLSKLVNLKNLDLADNNLESLPDIFSGLIHLEILHLEFNDLKSLPKSITVLPNLKELFIFENESLEDLSGEELGLSQK